MPHRGACGEPGRRQRQDIVAITPDEDGLSCEACIRPPFDERPQHLRGIHPEHDGGHPAARHAGVCDGHDDRQMRALRQCIDMKVDQSHHSGVQDAADSVAHGPGEFRRRSRGRHPHPPVRIHERRRVVIRIRVVRLKPLAQQRPAGGTLLTQMTGDERGKRGIPPERVAVSQAFPPPHRQLGDLQARDGIQLLLRLAAHFPLFLTVVGVTAGHDGAGDGRGGDPEHRAISGSPHERSIEATRTAGLLQQRHAKGADHEAGVEGGRNEGAAREQRHTEDIEQQEDESPHGQKRRRRGADESGPGPSTMARRQHHRRAARHEGPGRDWRDEPHRHGSHLPCDRQAEVLDGGIHTAQAIEQQPGRGQARH